MIMRFRTGTVATVSMVAVVLAVLSAGPVSAASGPWGFHQGSRGSGHESGGFTYDPGGGHESGGFAHDPGGPPQGAAFGTVNSAGGSTTTGACGTAGDTTTPFILTIWKGSTRDTVDLSATTNFVDPGVTAPTYANVCVGELVGATGSVSDDIVTATTVYVAPSAMPHPHGIFGTVTSAGGSTTAGACGTAGDTTTPFIMTKWKGATTFTVTVTSTTTFVARKMTSLSYANVCVGDVVGVVGTVSGSTVTADTVYVAPPGSDGSGSGGSGSGGSGSGGSGSGGSGSGGSGSGGSGSGGSGSGGSGSGGSGSGGSGSGASTCTSPVWSGSGAEDTYNTDPTDGEYYWVNNDAWSGGAGPQTINVCSASSWNAVSDQTDNGGQVETYPDTEYDVGGRDNPSTEPISDFNSIDSTFSEAFPTAGTSFDAAYDLWTNNWTDETMIWNQWDGTDDYWGDCAEPGPDQNDCVGSGGAESDSVAVTLDGVAYHFLALGSGCTAATEANCEYIFFRDDQVTSGSVDILAAWNWEVANGYASSSDVPTQLSYGVEIIATTGAQTFPLTGLTFSLAS